MLAYKKFPAFVEQKNQRQRLDENNFDEHNHYFLYKKNSDPY